MSTDWRAYSYFFFTFVLYNISFFVSRLFISYWFSREQYIVKYKYNIHCVDFFDFNFKNFHCLLIHCVRPVKRLQSNTLCLVKLVGNWCSLNLFIYIKICILYCIIITQTQFAYICTKFSFVFFNVVYQTDVCMYTQILNTYYVYTYVATLVGNELYESIIGNIICCFCCYF